MVCFRLKQEKSRVLDVSTHESLSRHSLLNGIDERSSHHTVHDAMIAAQRHRHHILHLELGLILYTSRLPPSLTLRRHHGLHHSANRQNARLSITSPRYAYLRRIDDRREGRDVVHSQVADGHASGLRSTPFSTPTAYSSGSNLPSLLLLISVFICWFRLSSPVLSTSCSTGVMSPSGMDTATLISMVL